MKQKLMKILLLYSIIGTLFVSCNLEEEYTSKKGYQEKMKISHVKFNELLKDKKFSNAYGKVQDKRSLVGKTVMEEQYNFTIADKPVKVLEWAEGITYTILINRTLKDNTFFENLVVEQFIDGEIRANIIKYTPFQPNNVQSYFSDGNFSGNRTLLPIIYNANESSLTGKFTNICSRVCTTICYQTTESGPHSQPHTPGKNCTDRSFIETDCERVCEWVDDGGGDGNTGTTETTGGDGSNNTPVGNPVNNCGNCNVPVYTAPVLEFEEEEEAYIIPPCDKLNNLFNEPDPNVKAIIDTLKLNIDINPKGEIGAVLKKRLPTEYLPATEKAQINFKTSNLAYTFIHTHPLSSFPMFTWGDILTLYELRNTTSKYNHLKGLESFLLICKDDNGNFQTYAIVFQPELFDSLDLIFKESNFQKFKNLTPAQIAALLDDELKEKYVNEDNSISPDYEKAFLQHLSELGSNLALYKANESLENWSRVVANTATQNTMEIPCE